MLIIHNIPGRITVSNLTIVEMIGSLLKVESCPGWVAQLVGALSQYAKVLGSLSGPGPYKNQPMNA